MKSAKSITPLLGFNLLRPCIKYIVAVNGINFIFLDTDLWVCSLDLKSFAITPKAKRHLFIPQTGSTFLAKSVSNSPPRNEFVFVKKKELLIIQRRMDYSEAITLSKAQQWSFNHASNMHLAVP